MLHAPAQLHPHASWPAVVYPNASQHPFRKHGCVILLRSATFETTHDLPWLCQAAAMLCGSVAPFGV